MMDNHVDDFIGVIKKAIMSNDTINAGAMRAYRFALRGLTQKELSNTYERFVMAWESREMPTPAQIKVYAREANHKSWAEEHKPLPGEKELSNFNFAAMHAEILREYEIKRLICVICESKDPAVLVGINYTLIGEHKKPIITNKKLYACKKHSAGDILVAYENAQRKREAREVGMGSVGV
jgi:hypothetical protein